MVSHTKVKSKFNLGILEIKHTQTYNLLFIENIKLYWTVNKISHLLFVRETNSTLKKCVDLLDQHLLPLCSETHSTIYYSLLLLYGLLANSLDNRFLHNYSLLLFQVQRKKQQHTTKPYLECMASIS